MEAQLINETLEAPSPRQAVDRPSRDALARGLDRYLRAAGAADDLQRRRLVLRILEKLQDEGDPKALPWAKAIATTDEVLNAEFLDRASARSGMKGRVALRLGPSTPAAGDWGTPARRYRAMRPCSLAPWRPSFRDLLQLPVPRVAQGLAACLCWLAVLVLP